MKLFLALGLFVVSLFCYSQGKIDTIKIVFLHGSKPAKGQKNEYKTVGGFLGGHVVTQIDTNVYGFNFKSNRIRIFPHRNNKCGVMEKESAKDFFKLKNGCKFTIISIPVTEKQYSDIKTYYESNVVKSDFDYAFLGMRCASACYKGLSLINTFKSAKNGRSIRKAFYPKRLRKKLCRLAEKEEFKIHTIKGRSGRRWEGD